MSYLIQNTYSPSYSLKISLRTKTAFLVRNSAVIYTLLNSTSLAFNLQYFTFSYSINAVVKLGYFFDKFTKVVFPKPKFLQYEPIGTNFSTSAYYTCLVNIDSLLTNSVKFTEFAPLSNNNFKYPYFLKTRIAITPIAKRPLSLALYKFLRMNLSI